jgi:FemAB-related protein (PEP-CTERM system-associated)
MELRLAEAGSVRIECLDSANADQVARWDAFVLTCPQATFFHRAGWQTVLSRVFGHQTYFLYAQVDGDIKGVLPLGEIRSRLFGHSLTSLPFAVYGGVAATDEVAREALEHHAQSLAQSLGAAHLELRHTERRHPQWPAQDLYVTFRKSILPKEEDNLLAIPRKQRAMVRKGIKLGLQSTVDLEVERFFKLYADNVHRHGTPALPKRYFQALRDTFGDDCEILTVTSSQGQPLSTVMSFYFRDEVLPYYAGDDEAARDLAANDFKYWELMRRACARGLKVFDYGRSKVGTGPYAFKKNWGFEPSPLHYEFCLYRRKSIPQNNPNNAKYRLLIAAWKRMPLSIANWLGPFIVRNLG